MFADLHIHSTYSDGTNTPKELIELAARKGISVLALADHDTIDGIEELAHAGERNGIETIPAVEISTSVNGTRIHILGYYIDKDCTKLKNYLSNMSKARAENTRLILERLNQSGELNYSWEQVLKHNKGNKWLGSVRVFEAMIKDGYYTSKKQCNGFYRRYFGEKSSAYIDLGGFSAQSAVEVILEAKGIPVVAHPKLIGDDAQVEELIGFGIKGIEVFYPAHDSNDLKRYLSMAERNGLIATGGTDWHGEYSNWDARLGDFGLDRDRLMELKALRNV